MPSLSVHGTGAVESTVERRAMVWIHLYQGNAVGRFGSLLQDVFGILALGALLNASDTSVQSELLPHWYQGLRVDNPMCETRVNAVAHFGFATPALALQALPKFTEVLCVPVGFRAATPSTVAAWERDGQVPRGMLDRIVQKMKQGEWRPVDTRKDVAVVHARRGDRADVGKLISPASLVDAMLNLATRKVGKVLLLTEPLHHEDLERFQPQPTTAREDAETILSAPLLIFVNGESSFTTMLSLLRDKPTIIVGGCLDERVRCDVVRPERGDVRIAAPLPELRGRPPAQLWMKRANRQHPLSLGPQWEPPNGSGGVWRHLWAAATSVSDLIPLVSAAK